MLFVCQSLQTFYHMYRPNVDPTIRKITKLSMMKNFEDGFLQAKKKKFFWQFRRIEPLKKSHKQGGRKNSFS